MSTSRLVMTIDTNLPVNTLRNILADSASRPLEKAQKVTNFFQGLKSGARAAIVNSGVADSAGVNALSASQTATLSGAATAADTITINGVALTAVSNVTTPTNNQFRVGTDAATAAANIAAAIQASTTDALSGVVHASALAGVVTVSCNIPGVIGNVITIAKSSTAITLGGALLAGGLGRLPSLTAFHFNK